MNSGSSDRTVLIIGGGIVGLAVAWKWMQRRPGDHLIVVEKEGGPAAHQSGHNSGVLHAGLYYRPGSLKAKLSTNGIRQMINFCMDYRISYDICGKLVLATNAAEAAGLSDLIERGTANGLRGLQKLGPEEIKEREPNAAEGPAALLVPEEGIVDYPAVCAELARQLREAGHELRFQHRVTAIQQTKEGWHLTTSQGDLKGSYLVNAAGLHCDRISQLAGARPVSRIIPFRGEYYRLKRHDLVRHLIYPVPDPRFPFLGVHFTRLIHGGTEAGPNAVLALAREGYRKSDFNLRDMGGIFGFPGFWRFLGRYHRMCAREFLQSLSRARFLAGLQRLVPGVTESDLEPGGAGVRAQAMSPEGRLVEDFDLLQDENALHILNAPSPAATASLAIADHLLDLALGRGSGGFSSQP